MTPSDPNARVRAVLDTERGRLAREASTWLVRLAESPDDAVLKASIERWCAESDLNREAWQRTQRTYGRLAEVPAAHPASWQESARRRGEHARAMPLPGDGLPSGAPVGRYRPLWRRRFVGAAAVVAAACVALVAGPSVVLSLRSDYATATAESRSVVLDDGSQVRLGPMSALQVTYSAGERSTRLLQGEAFFEVSRDERRPFKVVAGNVVTTVLGTAFDVLLEDDGAAVAVQSGRVHVTSDSLSRPVDQKLDAGETLQVKKDGRLARTTIAPEDVAAWRTGIFVARARPIGDIVAALRRYHDGVIVVRDEAFLSRRVTGAYDLRTPASTLLGLASAHDAVVRQMTPWLLVVTPR